MPWSIMEIVRDDAQRHHHQTLERLAERGGLSWGEIGRLFVRHAAIEQSLLAPYRTVEFLTRVQGPPS